MNADWGAVIATAGAIPGVLALGSMLVGWGKLTQRLNTVERDVADMKTVTAKVGVIEERTRNTAENVQAIRDGLDHMHQVLIQKAFDELRTFHPKE